jgi:penicillin-binding protein 1A
MKKLPFFWRTGLWAVMSLSFIVCVCFVFFYIYLESQLPDVESLKTVQLEVPLQIYTKDGLLIQEYGEKKRIPVTYDQIPPLLTQALLVTEDQRFFEHPGVDVFGLGRAAIRMIKTGTKSQGGSTITMQVARNFFLDRKKTFLRKFNEILLAIRIDKELSKEKILELYLNKIYLGNRAYGVEAAAQIYYGKTLKELSLSEMAMIAGLPQAPSTQNPITNPKAARKRRDHVLDRMLEEHIITEEQHQQAIAEPITTYFHTTNLQAHAPYVAEMIRQSLYDKFGPEVYSKGYKVYATIESRLQNAANDSIEKHLLAYDERHGFRGPVDHPVLKDTDSKTIQQTLMSYPVINDLKPAFVIAVNQRSISVLSNQQEESIDIGWSGLSWARPALKEGWVGRAPRHASDILQTGDIIYIREVDGVWKLSQVPEIEAALIAINPTNGAIQALVGGLNFPRSKFNRAIQSGRQPGSSFKPFLYAAALNKGYSLASIINDAPIVVDDPSLANQWRPHNVDHQFGGPTRLREALVQSKNLVSIRILDDIGIDYAIDFISRFGFNKTTLPHTLSLALGTLSVSPAELATAYAVFANGGYKIEPYLIDRITDMEGHILMQTHAIHRPYPYEKTKDASEIAPRVIPEEIAFLMHSAMTDVIQRGTAKEARALNRSDLAGKTGTTNDQVDAWFCGYTPDLVAVTWVGYDTPISVHEYGSRLALPLWIDFMKIALKELPEQPITPPLHVVTEYINPQTGAKERNPSQGILEYFRESEIPIDHNTPETNMPGRDTPQESLF